jgi:hypothetical protein
MGANQRLDVERQCAACRRCQSMASRRPRSRYLHNGYHSCKKARNLKIESVACWRKTFAITILLRTAKESTTWQQTPARRDVSSCWCYSLGTLGTNRCLGLASRGPKPHEQSSIGTWPRDKWTLCGFTYLGTPHNGHKPSPAPWCLATSTTEGRRSWRRCQPKILVLRGKGAFQSGGVHERPSKKGPVRWTDSEEPRRDETLRNTIRRGWEGRQDPCL